ncbi:MAG: hypothetical protein ABI333_11425 [bacterium]
MLKLVHQVLRGRIVSQFPDNGHYAVWVDAPSKRQIDALCRKVEADPRVRRATHVSMIQWR